MFDLLRFKSKHCVQCQPVLKSLPPHAEFDITGKICQRHVSEASDTQRDVRSSSITRVSYLLTSWHHLHSSELARDDRENRTHHTRYCSPYICTFYIFAS